MPFVWILGTGCAGKTTLCKYLAQKFDMFYYDSDTIFSEHLKISDKLNHPATNIDISDWEWYCSRPPAEYAKWLDESINEQLGFIVTDLLQLPKDKNIILDAHYFHKEIESISSYNHILFLTTDFTLVKEQFFCRNDKDDLHALIQSLETPEKKLLNLYNTLKLRHEQAVDKITNGNYTYFVREQDTKLEDMAEFAATHFNLK